MKTAIITGASSGIGRASAVALAEKGFCVCLVARRKEKLEEVCSIINGRFGGGRAIYVCGDVTDAEVRKRAVDSVMSKWGRIDVLVNNAGIVQVGNLEDVGLDEVENQFDVNVFSHVGYMKLVCPIMRRQGRGRVINIGSISGSVSTPGLGFYAASKSALESISDAARFEYESSGVDIIFIKIGDVVTELWEKTIECFLRRENFRSSCFRGIYSELLNYARRVGSGGGCSPKVIAEIISHAAVSRRPNSRYCVPLADCVGVTIMNVVPRRLRDYIIRKMFM